MGEGVRTAVAATLAYAVIAGGLYAAWTRYEPVRVAGGSMHPALWAGDMVIVKRNASPEVGDIALVREPGRSAVLHRVHERNGDGSLRLKGDANDIADLSDVDDAHVAGTVSRVVPIGALIARWRPR